MPQATTSSNTVIAPVYNLADNFSWTKHDHNLLAVDIRFISNRSSSNALSYSNASGTFQYLNPGTIAGSGGPFDPAAYGYPSVRSFLTERDYNQDLMYLWASSTLSNVTRITYTKSGNRRSPPTLPSRLIDWNEFEFCCDRDSWTMRKGLTLTYGLRYSYLQVPAETSGNQVGVCLLSGAVRLAQGEFSRHSVCKSGARQLAATGINPPAAQANSGFLSVGDTTSSPTTGRRTSWILDRGSR